MTAVKLTMLTSDMLSKLAMAISIPISTGSPASRSMTFNYLFNIQLHILLLFRRLSLYELDLGLHYILILLLTSDCC